MRQTAILFAILASAMPMLASDQKTQTFNFDGSAIRTIEIDHPVGDLEITEAAGSTVEVRMTTDCSGWNCGDKAADIRLKSSSSGGTLSLEVTGYPHFGGNINVNLEIRLPRDIDVTTDHGVGEVEIRGIAANIHVENGVGEVTIESSAAAFASASLESGVGEADLSVSGSSIEPSSSFIGSETEWKGGRGEHRIEVENGVGAANVTLN